MIGPTGFGLAASAVAVAVAGLRHDPHVIFTCKFLP
jgi:hypothetical protein